MIEILSVAGPAWVQDLGRPGHMHEGVPPGGALVPELLRAANAAVGNPQQAAAIEIFGSLRLRAFARLTVSLDGAPAIVLEEGAEQAFTSARRAGYVAVRGGVDVPLALGSRSTLPAAGIGGFEGRSLRRGDRLVIGGMYGAIATPAIFLTAGTIGVLPGPDLDRFAPDALTSFIAKTWMIAAASDRIGLRLEGATIEVRAWPDAVSCPMVQGAIQVPPSGQPIVLGPDHPTTGGYPVLAVVARTDLSRLFVRRPGSAVEFSSMD